MPAENALQDELRLFEQNRSVWLGPHSGEFVAIAGSNVIGFYPDFESAFKAGFKVVGLGNSFLVKQVLVEEPVYLIY